MISKLLKIENRFYSVRKVKNKLKKVPSSAVYKCEFESGERVAVVLGRTLVHQYIIDDEFEGEIISYDLPNDNDEVIVDKIYKLIRNQ